MLWDAILILCASSLSLADMSLLCYREFPASLLIYLCWMAFALGSSIFSNNLTKERDLPLQHAAMFHDVTGPHKEVLRTSHHDFSSIVPCLHKFWSYHHHFQFSFSIKCDWHSRTENNSHSQVPEQSHLAWIKVAKG